MINGLIGKKINMTTSFDEKKGLATPVTVIKLGPCKVTQVKTSNRDGYESVQIGFEEKNNLSKPKLGHQKRSDSNFKILKEVSADDVNSVEVGQSFDCSIFEVGEKVIVQGISKGKGFAVVMKRHNVGGMLSSHGVSVSHRAHGSTGQCQDPGKVFKGKKMAGQMGNERVTIQNLRVVSVDLEDNLVMVKGAVPGANGEWILVSDAVKRAANVDLPMPAGIKPNAKEAEKLQAAADAEAEAIAAEKEAELQAAEEQAKAEAAANAEAKAEEADASEDKGDNAEDKKDA